MNTFTSIAMRGALAVLLILFLCACRAGNSQEQKPESRTPQRNPFEITPERSLLEQIRTGRPKWAEVNNTLRVAGRVEADAHRIARVSAPAAGRIIELEVLEGQAVKRGQVLATLYSTELSSAQFAFLKAYSQQQLAERAVARAELLVKADVIGEAERQRREAELQQASAELSSSRDQLRVLGMSEDAVNKLQTTRTVNSLTQIVSSIDGTVLERKVTIGQVVQPADPVFVVADLSRVWLVADVPEQTAGNLTVGKDVEAEIAALPGQTIHGTLSFVSAIVNPETRTVRARMEVPNPERKYKPAMLATMLLKDGAERHRLVPSTAIVREENRDYIFVQTNPKTFVLRPVTLGPEFGNNRVVLDGIGPDETIVVEGAFHLNNQRRRLALQGQ